MNTSLDLAIEEALISPDSELAGKTLLESNIRRDFGIIMIAIKKTSSKMVVQPPSIRKVGRRRCGGRDWETGRAGTSAAQTGIKAFMPGRDCNGRIIDLR